MTERSPRPQRKKTEELDCLPGGGKETNPHSQATNKKGSAKPNKAFAKKAAGYGWSKGRHIHKMKECLRQQWNDACLQLGIPALTTPTSAKIMAILMHYGNNEALVLSPHFRADCEYIQKRYGIQGGEIPDRDFAGYLKECNAELEHCERPPKWAVELMKRMYNINIY